MDNLFELNVFIKAIHFLYTRSIWPVSQHPCNKQILPSAKIIINPYNLHLLKTYNSLFKLLYKTPRNV